MHRWYLAVAVALVAAGCGDDGAPARTFAVSGVVEASPTCPVQQPGQECPPAPVTGRVRLAEGDRTVAETTSDAQGRFAVDVPAGVYTLTVDTGAPLPSCPPQTVTVEAAPVALTVECDTGIR